MAISDILPWKREDQKEIQRREVDPVYALRNEINRMFDEFFREPKELVEWGTPLSDFLPQMDIVEKDDLVEVTLEAPGMDEKDIEVTLGDDYLTVCGSKKQEKQDKGARFYRSECSFGSFSRSVALPARIDADKVQASFKNGVLKIVLPKLEPAAHQGKRIQVKKV